MHAVGPRLLGAGGGPIRTKALKKGDLKFVLDGERLHGGWVLVRMKRDRRAASKRNNWLLIKHRDEYAREGDGDALLEDDDRSVASGRTMDEIAAGKGKGADAVHDRQASAPAGRGLAVQRRSAGGTDGRAAEAPSATAEARPRPCPTSSSRSSRKLGRAAAAGRGLGHEIKFDGYRMQLRVEDGKAQLRTRKGLDWTDKFQAIASDGASAARLHLIDGEVVRARRQRRAGLRRPCRRRCPTARPTT